MNRPTDTRDQEREIRALSKLVAKLKGANIIVGDFNATPHSVMLAILQSRTGMHRVTNLPTWPAVGPNLPQLSIDHMFISDGLKLLGPAIVEDGPVLIICRLRRVLWCGNRIEFGHHEV